MKLAIFNSCDGLGLAQQFETLQIPHIIVMREPIHDEVAQKFLNAFLTSFAEGTSLHEAVREARDQLKLIEHKSPNASWLPVIFQNPEEAPLFYPQKEPLPPVEATEKPEKRQKISKFFGWGMGAIALATFSLGIYKIIELRNDSTLVVRNEFKYVVSAYKGQHIELSCNMAEQSFNWMNVVEKIIKNKANSLMVATYVNNLPKAIELFKAVRENQLPIKLFGSPTLYTEQTIKLGGKAVENLILSVPYYPDEKEKNSFRTLWKAELNTWRSPLAKDTTRALVMGLDQLLKQPNPNRQELDNILRDPNFKVKGVTGEFKFASNTGEREFLFQKGRTDALIQVKNGKFVKID